MQHQKRLGSSNQHRLQAHEIEVPLLCPSTPGQLLTVLEPTPISRHTGYSQSLRLLLTTRG